MTAYETSRSTTQTLTGTNADQVTLTQRWGAVRVTNLHSSNRLWVTPNNVVAVAAADGAIPVLPNTSRVIDVAHVSNARTMILGVVGDGNQYTVEGMFGSQAEVLSALADEVAEGLDNATSAHGATVRRTSAQSIPNSIATVISFNSELDDDGTYWDAANPTRIVIPTTGVYLLGGMVRFNNVSANGRYIAWFTLNGTATQVGVADERLANSGYYPSPQPVTRVLLTAGNYVELIALQTSGASQNTLANDTSAWIERLGA